MSGEFFFDPVLQAAANGRTVVDQPLKAQYYFDNSQIGSPCDSGGNTIGRVFVGDGTSLLGSHADGLDLHVLTTG